MSWEERLQRPCLGDDGQLAPELLRLWARTLTTDGTIGYRLKRSVRRQLALAKLDEEQEAADDVENARNNNAEDDGMNFMDGGDGANFVDASNDWGAADDDVMMPAGDETFGDVSAEFENVATYGKSEMGGESFSLKAVNELEEVDTSIMSKQQGGATRDASAKWHPHTVKVLDMLRKNMEGEDTLNYNDLSKGCSRRTAAGVFFELLQLKSWNYIELQQGGAYGDIVIAKGAKFDE